MGLRRIENQRKYGHAKLVCQSLACEVSFRG